MNNISTHIRHVSLGYRLITWLWAGTLLLSTMGVSVHAVYCYCSGQTDYSLLSAPETHNCAIEKEESCCISTTQKTKTQSCCAPAPQQESVGCDVADEKGCMKDTTYTFVLKTDLQVEKTIEKVLLPDFWLDTPEIPTYELVWSINLSQSYFPVFPLPPPPALSGRMICIRHQLFLC